MGKPFHTYPRPHAKRGCELRRSTRRSVGTAPVPASVTAAIPTSPLSTTPEFPHEKTFLIASGAVLCATFAGPAIAGSSTETGNLEASASVPTTGWPYDGMIEITAIAGTSCSVAKGDIFYSVYRPKYDGTDNKSAGLSILSKRSGFIMTDKSTGQKFSGSGAYDIGGIGSRGTFYSTTNAGNYNLTVKFDTGVHTTAATVIITGTVTNFWTDSGCTATIRGVYQRRAN